MDSSSFRAPVVPSNAPARPKARPVMGGKLRNIITPKPRLTSGTAFQTRLPIRKKREYCEISPDENETMRNTRQARIRQRCDSGNSVRTVAARQTRTRASSQDSVRTIKNEPASKTGAHPAIATLAKSLSEPIRGEVSRSDRASAPASAAKTPSALKRTTYHNKASDEKVNTLRFPSDIAAVPVARTGTGLAPSAKKRSSSKPRGVGDTDTSLLPVKTGKDLKRTQSHPALHVDEKEKDFDRLDRICAASIEVYKVQVDEVLDEIRRAKADHHELLGEEDEVIVQKVVKDVVEDPAVEAEFEALARSPRGHIIMDDLEEIPDMFSDEEIDVRCQRAPSVPPSARWSTHDRFDVTVKPMSKHTTMWDVNFEDTYAWQGLLFVTDAKPHIEARPEMPILDIELEWRTIDACTRSLRSDDEPEYAVRYDGATLPGAQILAQMHPAWGIYTQPMWSYLSPDFHGTGAGGAWALRFWVPVPMCLFRGRDVRRFVLDARVAFGDWDVMTGIGYSERVDVTIEHLRREREMKIATKA